MKFISGLCTGFVCKSISLKCDKSQKKKYTSHTLNSSNSHGARKFSQELPVGDTLSYIRPNVKFDKISDRPYI